MQPLTLTAPERAAPGRRLRAASDERLVSGLRRGDARCFDVIYDRYHRQLLSFCRHMLGSREEAEDALQQVFVSAHGRLVADGRPVELRPWLYAIARNRCLSMLRARRQTVALEDVPEASGDGLALAAEVEQRQDLRDLLGDLARLPEDQRAALVLAELGDLSHDEIGVALDVRSGKVKALVFQAREQLMGYRQARQADCTEIREQLSTLRGSALRKAPLQRHLAVCPACSEFKAEVTRQRAALGAVLPVIPAIGLRDQILGAVHASHSAAVAGAGAVATGGVVASTGGAGAGVAAGSAGVGGALSGGSGLAAAVGSAGVVAKSIAVVAVVAAAGGGAVAVSEHHGSTNHGTPSRTVPASAPKGAVSPTAVPGASGPAGTKTVGKKASSSPGALHGRTTGVAHKAAKGASGQGAATSAAHRSPNAHPGGSSAAAHAHTKSNGAASSAGKGSATGQAHRTAKTTPKTTAKRPERIVTVKPKTTSHLPARPQATTPKATSTVPKGKATRPATSSSTSTSTTESPAPVPSSKGLGSGIGSP